MPIKLKVREPSVIKLTAQSNGPIQLQHLNDVIGLASDPYEGEYTVNPNETVQTLPTNGKGMLDDVTVTAIPSDYVGSAVERRGENDLIATGNLVNVPSGFYEENCGKEIGYGSVAVPSVNIEAHPVITTDNNGLISVSVSESESVSPAVTNGYVTAEQGHAGTITFAGTASSQLSTQGATSVHPSTSSQTAAPSGVFTTGAITVEPMDLETVSKSYTPSTSAQSETITPSVGKDGIAQVDVSVAAMPTGNRGNSTVYVSQTASEVRYTVKHDNATSGYYASSQLATDGTVILTKETQTVTPSTADQTVAPSGSTKYLSSVTVEGDPNLTQMNILGGASIFGVNGYPLNKNTSVPFGEEAGSAAIRNGKKAWVNGNLVTGSATEIAEQTITPSKTAQTVLPAGSYLTGAQTIDYIPSQYYDMSGEYAWLGKDFEVVNENFYLSEWVLKNTGFNGWTPSTTAKDIIASTTAGTFVADLLNYEYYLVWRSGIDIAYTGSPTLKALPTFERAMQIQEVFRRCGTWANIQDGTPLTNTSGNIYTSSFLRYYGTTTGTITYTWATSNGFYHTLTAATFSNGTANNPTVTVKTPKVTAKCSTTYMSTASAGAIDQDNTKGWISCSICRVKTRGIERGIYDETVKLINTTHTYS